MMIKLKTILLEIALGDCYQAAGRLMTSLPDGHTLVHGMVNGQGALDGKRFGHAWVETDNTVLDYSNGRELEIPKAVYYAIGRIKKDDNKYYNKDETLKWILKTEHWGPWEMSGDVVDISEDIPDQPKEVGKEDVRLSRKELQTIKMIKLKDLLPEDFNDAAFHGNGMTPQEMRTGTCSVTWENPDQDTGCPQFSFKGGKISKETQQLAMRYLDTEDVKTLIAFSAGGPLLMQALTAGARRPDQINFVAPAWKKHWVSGPINPKDSAGKGFIVHGTDDIAVPIAHSIDLSLQTGMPLYIFPGKGHINILKHKMSPAGGKLVKGDMLKTALQQLPDWGDSEGTKEDTIRQQKWFDTL